jgi:hypothetical protein
MKKIWLFVFSSSLISHEWHVTADSTFRFFQKISHCFEGSHLSMRNEDLKKTMAQALLRRRCRLLYSTRATAALLVSSSLLCSLKGGARGLASQSTPTNSIHIPVFFDSTNSWHRDNEYHPEQPERITVCVQALLSQSPSLSGLVGKVDLIDIAASSPNEKLMAMLPTATAGVGVDVDDDNIKESTPTSMMV